MLIIVVILFYDTELRYCHGVAVNYCGKKCYSIGARIQPLEQHVLYIFIDCRRCCREGIAIYNTTGGEFSINFICIEQKCIVEHS
jgi:hypothetical protein